MENPATQADEVRPAVSLIPVDWPAHEPLLTRWLKDPDVRRWWGDPERRRNQIRATATADHAIIAAGDTPIGYIRWQGTDRESLDALGLQAIPTGAIDIDLFIGEAAWRGRSLATPILHQLTARLSHETQAPAAGLCTSVNNHIAHRAFTKAGFTNTTQYDDPEFGHCYVFLKQLYH